jgi:hypothetical protein
MGEPMSRTKVARTPEQMNWYHYNWGDCGCEARVINVPEGIPTRFEVHDDYVVFRAGPALPEKELCLVIQHGEHHNLNPVNYDWNALAEWQPLLPDHREPVSEWTAEQERAAILAMLDSWVREREVLLQDPKYANARGLIDALCSDASRIQVVVDAIRNGEHLDYQVPGWTQTEYHGSPAGAKLVKDLIPNHHLGALRKVWKKNDR